MAVQSEQLRAGEEMFLLLPQGNREVFKDLHIRFEHLARPAFRRAGEKDKRVPNRLREIEKSARDERRQKGEFHRQSEHFNRPIGVLHGSD